MAKTHSTRTSPGSGRKVVGAGAEEAIPRANGYRAGTHPTGGEIHLLNFPPPNFCPEHVVLCRYRPEITVTQSLRLAYFVRAASGPCSALLFPG